MQNTGDRPLRVPRVWIQLSRYHSIVSVATWLKFAPPQTWKRNKLSFITIVCANEYTIVLRNIVKFATRPCAGKRLRKRSRKNYCRNKKKSAVIGESACFCVKWIICYSANTHVQEEIRRLQFLSVISFRGEARRENNLWFLCQYALTAETMIIDIFSTLSTMFFIFNETSAGFVDNFNSSSQICISNANFTSSCCLIPREWWVLETEPEPI